MRRTPASFAVTGAVFLAVPFALALSLAVPPTELEPPMKPGGPKPRSLPGAEGRRPVEVDPEVSLQDLETRGLATDAQQRNNGLEPTPQRTESPFSSMSTASLLDACLGDPAVAYELGESGDMPGASPQRGIRALEERHVDVLTALLSRHDAAAVLTDRYRQMEIDERAHTDEEFDALGSIDRLMIVQALLGDTRVLDQLSPAQLKPLLCLVLDKEPRVPADADTLIPNFIRSAWKSWMLLGMRVLERFPPPADPGASDFFHSGQTLFEAKAAIAAAGACQ